MVKFSVYKWVCKWVNDGGLPGFEYVIKSIQWQSDITIVNSGSPILFSRTEGYKVTTKIKSTYFPSNKNITLVDEF